MTWTALLLSNPSPCFRYLVLTGLMGRAEDDPEVREVSGLREEDPLFTELAGLQEKDGSWTTLSSKIPPRGRRIVAASQALYRLGTLGFGPDHPVVQKGAAYMFKLQQQDGSWPLPGDASDEGSRTYSMMPLQTAVPLEGLSRAGYARDPRIERAYQWLMRQQLEEGAWPTGLAGDVYGYVAGYRRMPRSRWGCRSNTTSALIGLSFHPDLRKSEEARKALDLLLGRETRETSELGYEIARLMGAVSLGGFITFHRTFDLALILGLCARIGADAGDPRVASLIHFIEGLQNPHGLWIPSMFPHMAHWLTLDILLSLKGLDQDAEWVSMEPRTPFAPYPAKRGRY
jgi:hypothetical protein